MKDFLVEHYEQRISSDEARVSSVPASPSNSDMSDIDLLWKYHVKHSEYSQASQILSQMAEALP